jgi:DNA primase
VRSSKQRIEPGKGANVSGETAELLEKVIYPKLSHEIVFGDLKDLRLRGKAYVATCPHCGGEDHFYALPDWKFGKCHRGRCIYHGKGNVLSWWTHTADRFNLKTNYEILRKLAELAGVDLQEHSRSRVCTGKPATVAEVYRLFIDMGQKAAVSLPDALDEYLAKRGLGRKEIKKAGVIYMERDRTIKALFKAGCTKELIEQAGLFTVGFGDIYHIILPYYDEHGLCKGFVGRLDPWLTETKETPKYKNSFGTTKDVPFLFHLATAPGIYKVIIVEGPLDALLINLQCKMKGAAAVALCGDTLSDAGLALINGLPAPVVVLALDDDVAGRLGSLGLIKGLKKRVLVANNFLGHKDPGELIPAEGPGKFSEAVDNAIPAVTWVFRTVFERAYSLGASAKIDRLAELASIHQVIPTEEGKLEFIREARKATLLHEATIRAIVEAA